MSELLRNPRNLVIVVAVLGMLLCTISVGRFIARAPVHPLTIAGYLFGTLGLFTLLVQIFGWRVAPLDNPKVALIVMGLVIVAKIGIGRLYHLLP